MALTLGTATHRNGINRRDVLRMGVAGSLLGAGALVAGHPAMAMADDGSKSSAESCGRIEPTAGRWKTWVLSSGSDLRLPPPPGAAATRSEIETLEALVGQRDAATLVRTWTAHSRPLRLPPEEDAQTTPREPSLELSVDFGS